jgi:hypothetical protein
MPTAAAAAGWETWKRLRAPAFKLLSRCQLLTRRKKTFHGTTKSISDRSLY